MANTNEEWWFCHPSKDNNANYAKIPVRTKLDLWGKADEDGDFYSFLGIKRDKKLGLLFKFRISSKPSPEYDFLQTCSEPAAVAEILAAQAMKRLRKEKRK